MNPVHLNCPLCSAIFQIDVSMSGQQVACPTCHGVVTIPPLPGQSAAAPPPGPAGAFEMDCPLCGQVFQATDDMAGMQVACPHCSGAVTIPPVPVGEALPADAPPGPLPARPPLGSIAAVAPAPDADVPMGAVVDSVDSAAPQASPAGAQKAAPDNAHLFPPGYVPPSASAAPPAPDEKTEVKKDSAKKASQPSPPADPRFPPGMVPGAKGPSASENDAAPQSKSPSSPSVPAQPAKPPQKSDAPSAKAAMYPPGHPLAESKVDEGKSGESKSDAPRKSTQERPKSKPTVGASGQVADQRARDMLPPGAAPATSAPSQPKRPADTKEKSAPRKTDSTGDSGKPPADQSGAAKKQSNIDSLLPPGTGEAGSGDSGAGDSRAASTIDALLPPGAEADVRPGATTAKRKSDVDSLLPPGAEADDEPATGQQVALPSDEDGQNRPLAKKDKTFAIPTEDGGVATLHEPVKKVRLDENEELELHSLTPEEKARRRLIRSLVMWAFCAAVLGLSLLVLLNL